MGNILFIQEAEPIPRKGVPVSEQCQRTIEDLQLNDYRVGELAERFGVSRGRVHRRINRQRYGRRSVAASTGET